MRRQTVITVGVAVAAGLFIVVASQLGRKRRPLEIRSQDLGYQEHSPAELASEHLMDLNAATHDDLVQLGLNNEMTSRILENRPYRNKMELLSRMVIPEVTYTLIKDHIGVAGATQSIKMTCSDSPSSSPNSISVP